MVPSSPCIECKHLSERYLLARRFAFELEQHRNNAIWRYDPDSAWQLDMLIAFIIELRDEDGVHFVDHHRRAHGRPTKGYEPETADTPFRRSSGPGRVR